MGDRVSVSEMNMQGEKRVKGARLGAKMARCGQVPDAVGGRGALGRKIGANDPLHSCDSFASVISMFARLSLRLALLDIRMHVGSLAPYIDGLDRNEICRLLCDPATDLSCDPWISAIRRHSEMSHALVWSRVRGVLRIPSSSLSGLPASCMREIELFRNGDLRFQMKNVFNLEVVMCACGILWTEDNHIQDLSDAPAAIYDLVGEEVSSMTKRLRDAAVAINHSIHDHGISVSSLCIGDMNVAMNTARRDGGIEVVPS